MHYLTCNMVPVCTCTVCDDVHCVMMCTVCDEGIFGHLSAEGTVHILRLKGSC